MSKSVIYTFDASEQDKSLPAHCLYSCGNTLQSLLKDQGVKESQMMSVLKGEKTPHCSGRPQSTPYFCLSRRTQRWLLYSKEGNAVLSSQWGWCTREERVIGTRICKGPFSSQVGLKGCWAQLGEGTWRQAAHQHPESCQKETGAGSRVSSGTTQEGEEEEV